MRSFPWDSIVTSMGDDGFPIYDRAYAAADLREVYETFFSNGVFLDTDQAFRVVPSDGMSVVVSPGKCHVNGTVGFERNQRKMELVEASAQDRIDTVVLRWDANVEKRSVDLYVRTGTAAAVPSRPQLTRSETVNELGLADIFVPANTTAVSAERITDTRLDTARCGVVTPFSTIDTTTFFDQIQAAIDKQVGELQDQTDKAVDLANSMLDGTVVGELQQQIDKKVGLGVGTGEEIDKADIMGAPGPGGFVEIYAEATPYNSKVRLQADGIVKMQSSDGSGWELPVGNVAQQLRGNATDLSYAALAALAPGFYLVPSTAANQPTSGQGDGNLMVGRVSSNRVWAVVAYNTGAVYCAYGYEHGGSAATWKWTRIDNNSVAASAITGTLPVKHGGTGVTALTGLSGLICAMFDGSADGKSGYAHIPTFNGNWEDGAFYTLSGLLKAMGIIASSGLLKVGTQLIQWGYTTIGSVAAHAYKAHRVTIPVAYANVNFRVFAFPYISAGIGNGDTLGWSSMHSNYPGGSNYFTLGFGNGSANAMTVSAWWMTVGTAA